MSKTKVPTEFILLAGFLYHSKKPYHTNYSTGTHYTLSETEDELVLTVIENYYNAVHRTNLISTSKANLDNLAHEIARHEQRIAEFRAGIERSRQRLESDSNPNNIAMLKDDIRRFEYEISILDKDIRKWLQKREDIRNSIPEDTTVTTVYNIPKS